MGRLPRWVPEGGALVEITNRTLQGRFLLRPSAELCEVTIGILARAQRKHPAKICAFHFLSNHYHLLLEVEDAAQMAGFMEYFDGNLAREAGRLVGWQGRFWAGRYHHTVVSDEESAQAARLQYILSQGVKEGLVKRPEDWPGPHGVTALLTGKPLSGFWVDRSRECAARSRGKTFSRYDFATEETISLVPLPCWRHLPDAVFRQRVAELVEKVVTDAAAERRASGHERVSGAEAVSARTPDETPKKPAKSPKPAFHAATHEARRRLREAFALFLAAFRAASMKLREGDRGAVFPEGSFPPRLPFVRLASVRGP